MEFRIVDISRIALLALLIVTSGHAPATPAAGSESGIPPVIWEVFRISAAEGTLVEISDPQRYTVQFQPEGEFAVTAGCDQATGTHTTGDGTLDITLPGLNHERCAPLAKADGERILALLVNATRYEFDRDGNLVLARDDESLWLRPRLTGVIWDWQTFRGGDDSRIEPQNSGDYTLTFLPQGNLIVEAGCIRAMGTYSADGAMIELQVGRASHVTCPGQSVANQFLRDLGEVTSHVFRDGNLYLALWADAGIMEFAARYPDSLPATPEAG